MELLNIQHIEKNYGSNHKFSNGEKCKTPHLYEDEIKQNTGVASEGINAPL